MVKIPEKFQCSLCDFKSKEKVGITNHIKTTHAYLVGVKCHYCNKNLPSYSDLAAHKKDMHSSYKKWVCKHCPKGFARKKLFINHVVNCHGADTMSEDEILLFAKEPPTTESPTNETQKAVEVEDVSQLPKPQWLGIVDKITK